MERNIGFERVFWLGDYRNIKITDLMVNVPERVVLNDELVGELMYYQMLTIEKAFRRYLQLAEQINTVTTEEAIAFIESEKESALKKLTSILSN